MDGHRERHTDRQSRRESETQILPSVASLCHPCVTTIKPLLYISQSSLKLPPPSCAVLLVLVIWDNEDVTNRQYDTIQIPLQSEPLSRSPLDLRQKL